MKCKCVFWPLKNPDCPIHPPEVQRVTLKQIWRAHSNMAWDRRRKAKERREAEKQKRKTGSYYPWDPPGHSGMH